MEGRNEYQYDLNRNKVNTNFETSSFEYLHKNSQALSQDDGKLTVPRLTSRTPKIPETTRYEQDDKQYPDNNYDIYSITELNERFEQTTEFIAIMQRNIDRKFESIEMDTRTALNNFVDEATKEFNKYTDPVQEELGRMKEIINDSFNKFIPKPQTP